MPAGLITKVVKFGDSSEANVFFWSSDGATDSGANLAGAYVLTDGSGNVVNPPTQAQAAAIAAALAAIETSIGGVIEVKRPGVTPATTPAAAAFLQVKLGACVLSAIDIAAEGTSGWLLLVDANAEPGAGAISPMKAYWVAANSSERWQFDPPLQFATGAMALFSSTGPFVFTPSATVFMSGEAQ